MAISKSKKIKKYRKNFGAYLIESMKKMCGEIGVSIF